MVQESLPEEPQPSTIEPIFFYRWIQKFYRHIRKLSRNYELIKKITASETAGINDCFFVVDATAGNVLITLPAQSKITNGKRYRVKKSDSSANTVTIASADTATFKDETIISWQYDELESIADGTDWQVREYNHEDHGTFSPELWDDTLATDATPPTYAVQIGYYRRLKDILTIYVRIRVTSLGSLTTTQSIRVGNFPNVLKSTVNHQEPLKIGFVDQFHASASDVITGLIDATNNYADLYKDKSNGATTTLLVSDFSADGEIIFTASYTI